MRILGFLLTLMMFGVPFVHSAETSTPNRALYLSGNHTYLGFVFKPAGKGPFPAVIFAQSLLNSKDYGEGTEFASLAQVFTSRGYVFFVPGRHQPPPRSREDNENLGKDEKQIRSHQFHGANLIAAMAWLKAQMYVDESRLVVIADSAGGVSTLLAPEDDLGVNGYILFSPGTQALEESPRLRQQLRQIVQRARTPMFLIQTENSYSLLPAQLLGTELEKKGSPNRLKIYSAFGDLVGEAQKFSTDGFMVWQRDVFAFITLVNTPFGPTADAAGK